MIKPVPIKSPGGEKQAPLQQNRKNTTNAVKNNKIPEFKYPFSKAGSKSIKIKSLIKSFL